MYETSRQSRFNARYWMPGAGALGWPRGMVWGGRREEGSGWGTHVCLWWIHFDIWQNQYNIVKFKNKIKNKTSLNIRKFRVHILLKPGLENFEHYFTSVWDECNCAVVWAFFGIAFLWDWNSDLFQSCGHCWVFQICWPIECSTFTTLFFRIWNSSTEILSPPLALFVVMLSKAHIPGCVIQDDFTFQDVWN